jgi:dTDP-4-amino-4,6-dideoxygalactose transaminase
MESPKPLKIPFVDLRSQYNSIKSEIDNAILEVIHNSAFISGKYLRSFEQNFAHHIGTKHCIGVGNGTDALFIALKVLGIGREDDVITVANSFIATSEAITMTGAPRLFLQIAAKRHITLMFTSSKKLSRKKQVRLSRFIFMVILQKWTRLWKLRKSTNSL